MEQQLQSILQVIFSLEEKSFDPPYTEAQIEAELTHKSQLMLLVDATGRMGEWNDFPRGITPPLRGYLSARILLEENTVDLHRIAVHPEWRKKGLGRALMERMKTETLQYLSRPAFIILEVSENNIAAIHLYGSMGFQIIHRRKSYYKDGSAALIMRATILS